MSAGQPRRDSTSSTPTPAFPVVALAASAGVVALSDVLEDLPAAFPAAVLALLQGRRTDVALAAILGRRASLPVRDAEDGDRLRPGAVLVAPPDRHLVVEPGDTLRLLGSAPVHKVRPAADVLFRSLAAACGPRVVAVVLKGLGADGAGGAVAVKRAGGTVLAEEQGTPAAGGMTAADVAAGAADRVLPHADIAGALVRLAKGREE